MGIGSAILEANASPVRTESQSPIEARLDSIRYAARDTHLYEFSRTDGAMLPDAQPGAHIDLHLPNGLTRQYSLVIPRTSPKSYVLGIKRDPASRGGSRYIFDELRVGNRVKISHPRNNFPLAKAAAHSVLIAGGIGITPIWAMGQDLQRHGQSWELHYSCRSKLDMAFLEHFQNLPCARLHFDEEDDARLLDLNAIVSSAPNDAHLYCCGPLPMLNAFEAATINVPSERVHVEYFTPGEAPNLQGGFVVQLARSGRQFAIPAGKSILDVLREAGIDAASSCQEGICGTCETAVLSGVPDHRDGVLSDSERAANRTMMICCSGAKSDRLVLDI